MNMGRRVGFLLLSLFVFQQCNLAFCECENADRVEILSRESFPEGFFFGTASSAYQVEGMADKAGRGPSIWDVFVKIPGITAGSSTGEVAVDEYHRYQSDIKLMKKFNFDAYRLSISWSRIFPDGTGRVNFEGVDYYDRVIDSLIEQGITPFVNLYHYDLPQTLQLKYNGWLDRQVVNDFADYAEFCFKTFGDRVKNWFTFNEPRVVAALGYDDGTFAPGRCTKEFRNCTAVGNSSTEPYIVAHHLILSHAMAVNRYRTKYQAEQKGKIGILCDFVWYEAHSNTEEDEQAAQRARDFHVGWFLHPLTYGEYPKNIQEIVQERLPKFTHKEIELVKGSIDYVGINQYTTYYTRNNPGTPAVITYSNDWHVEFMYARDGIPVGPRAHSKWLYMVPWGMYKAVTYIKENYGNPTVMLSENGMDYGDIPLPHGLYDFRRIDYYQSYLLQLKKAIDHGANVVGYFAWSLLDNFEWLSGYTSRFGLVYVDYKTQKRHPKMSALWFKEILARKN